MAEAPLAFTPTQDGINPQEARATDERGNEMLPFAFVNDSQPRHAPGLPPGDFPKSVSRWNYWLIPALNPWAGSHDGLLGPFELDPHRVDEITHQALEAEFQQKAAAGDEEAPFRYVEINAHAFRSPWLVTTIERWRNEGRFSNLVRLMKTYARRSGKTPLSDLVTIIEKDISAFELMIRWIENDKRDQPSGSPVAEASFAVDDAGIGSSADARLIHQHYRPLYDEVVPARFSRDQFFVEMRAILNRLKASLI
jgi:hypothetical protein